MELIAGLGLSGLILSNGTVNQKNNISDTAIKIDKLNSLSLSQQKTRDLLGKNIYSNISYGQIYRDIDAKEQKQYDISRRPNTNVINPISEICTNPNKNMTGNNIELMSMYDNDSVFSDDYQIPFNKAVSLRQPQRKQMNRYNSPSNNSNDVESQNFYSDVLSEDAMYEKQLQQHMKNNLKKTTVKKNIKNSVGNKNNNNNIVSNKNNNNVIGNKNNNVSNSQNKKPNLPNTTCRSDFDDQFDPLEFDYKKKLPDTYNNTSSSYKVTNGFNVTESDFDGKASGSYGVTSDMTHNNMLPQFKTKTFGFNPEREGKLQNVLNQKLELFSGSDQALQFRHKSEVDTMFSPSTNYTETVSGMPNFSNFFQSRVIPSQTRNGELPFPTVKVTPGLNLGYYETGNSGPYDRSFRPTPKTVDELRVVTDPKVSWTAPMKPGYKYSKGPTIGSVEHKGPDSFYFIDPSSVAPTNGDHVAPRLTGKFALDPSARAQTAENTHLNPISNMEANTPEYLQGQFSTPFKRTYETDGPRGQNRENFGNVMANYTPLDATMRSTDNQHLGTTKGNYNELPLMNFMNAIPDQTLKDIILEDNGRKNLGIISNKINGYLFNTINSIPDPTLRSIISENVKLKQINGNHQQGQLFNSENAITDPNMRNLSENNIYVKPISNKEQGYLFDYVNGTPDPNLKAIINACWGSGGKGFTGNHQQNQMFDYQNGVTDVNIRNLTENQKYQSTITGNHQQNQMFDYQNGVTDVNIRNLTENQKYQSAITGNHQQNQMFDYQNGVTDVNMRNLTENQKYQSTITGNHQQNQMFDYKNGIPDETLRSIISDIQRMASFNGNHTAGQLVNYVNAIPDTTLKELTENNVNLKGFQGNQLKTYMVNYLNAVPDTTLRELTENNTNIKGFKGNHQQGNFFNFINGTPDITMRNTTENTKIIKGVKGNHQQGNFFNFVNGVPDITMRNTTENNTNIIGFKGNHQQLRSQSDVSNALINSNREIVLTKREGENGCLQTEGKTAFFTEYEFCDDNAKKFPVFSSNRLKTTIKNELYFG